jgi:hypothetical protein
MSSSISGSERRSWRRLLALYAGGVAVIGLVTAVLLLAFDPYDTGRFSVVSVDAVPDFGPRMTAASLGREPEMDTAIIGNSTIQLVDPVRVGAASGRHVVSLTIPGTGPLEQLTVAAYFLRHHPGTAHGLVIGIDGTWCRAQGRLDFFNPFPSWLYSEHRLDYVLAMMRLKTFNDVKLKVMLWLGRARPARHDGYSDFEIGRAWDAEAARARLTQSAADAAVPDLDAAPDDVAAVPLLRDFLAKVPAEVSVVLVLPPRYHDPEVAPAAAAAARQQGCTGAFRQLAQSRRNTSLLDFLSQRHVAGGDEFWDVIHYRGAVVRQMEPAIAAALREPE